MCRCTFYKYRLKTESNWCRDTLSIKSQIRYISISSFSFLFTRHSQAFTFLHNILWYFPVSPTFSDIFLYPWHSLTFSFLHEILWHSSFHAPIQPFFLFQPDTLWFNLSLSFFDILQFNSYFYLRDTLVYRLSSYFFSTWHACI